MWIQLRLGAVNLLNVQLHGYFILIYLTECKSLTVLLFLLCWASIHREFLRVILCSINQCLIKKKISNSCFVSFTRSVPKKYRIVISNLRYITNRDFKPEIHTEPWFQTWGTHRTLTFVYDYTCSVCTHACVRSCVCMHVCAWVDVCIHWSFITTCWSRLPAGNPEPPASSAYISLVPASWRSDLWRGETPSLGTSLSHAQAVWRFVADVSRAPILRWSI